jgi:hypothetical protein
MLMQHKFRSHARKARRLRSCATEQISLFRRCLFEQLEDRRMLAALPTIEIDDVRQVEGDSGTTDFVFTVTRSGKTNGSSTIGYSTAPGSATSGDDYAATSGTLSFAAKETAKTIVVPVVGDTTVEDNETFYVDLTIIDSGQFGISRGVGTIVSDDTGPSLPELAIDDVQIDEGDSGTTTMDFTVTRSGDLSGLSSVDFSITDGTATISGNDYDVATTSGTLSFRIDEEFKTVTVDVNGDTISEGSEVLYVDLSAPDNAVITVPRGTGLIVGDDGGLAPPAGLVSWWTADGTAADLMQRNDAELVDGTTYAPGMVGQAFDFDGVNDRVQLPDSESLKLTESLSIEAWIKADSLPEQQGEILFRGDDRGGLDPYSLSLQNNGSLRFEVASLNGAASVWAPLPLGQFTHVAGTLDDASGAMRLYLDGVLISQITTTQRPFGDLDPASNPGIGIGNHGGAPDTPHNFPFDGLIDELSVYNRALTTEEVQRIYHTGGQGKVKMTVAQTSPEPGSVLAVAPTQFVIDFTFPVDAVPIEALLVNNLTADEVTLNDLDTATFTYFNSPVASQGLQTMHLAEGAVTRASDGLGLAEYHGEFRYDVTPLTVAETAPAVGSDLLLEQLTAPTTAVLSMAGMNGYNGAWPVLYGTDPLSSSEMQVVLDEDTLFDTERSHTTEQLGFVAFDGITSGNVAPYLRTGIVSGVTNTGWTTVTLPPDHDYDDRMVVVATANYAESSPPLVTRIQNALDDSFEVQVARADGLTDAVSGVDVHYVVVEEGVYGNMEAVRFESTVTDGFSSWAGESQTYQNVYSNPVVVGQVMTANDPEFSVFWARGADAGSPPSSDSLFVGKHVGEDANQTRATETVGYLVLEQGTGSFGDVEYLAAVGADAVHGIDDGPSTYHLNLSTLQVTFSEPIDATSVGPDDLQLSAGRVTRAEVLGPDVVSYALVGVSPALRVDMQAGAITDQFGNPMLSFTGRYNPVPTKFYVVDSRADAIFEYGATGVSLDDQSWSMASTADEAVGATANADGTRIWVLDFDMIVFVYDNDGTLVGSWFAEKGGTPVSSPNGIATDGTDIWIVDAWGAQVKRYAGAATRDAGSQAPISSFKIDKHGTGITTDGNTIWIVNRETDRVYMYTTDGDLYSEWPLHNANTWSVGATIDPSGASNSIWIVDRDTDSVYEYHRDTGEFRGSFALDNAAGNTYPSGIADPPPPTVGKTMPRSLVDPSLAEPSSTTSWLASASYLPLELSQRPSEPQFVSLWSEPVDEHVVPSDFGRKTAWVNETWLLPLSPADVVQRPEATKAFMELCFHEIADEEVDLLDDDLLALIAAGWE